MTRLIFIAVLSFCSASLIAQPSVRGEFATESNGLMYSNADMKVLRFMVDSLNLRFKTCDLTKTFYSKPQGNLIYVYFKSDKNGLKNIIDDINKNTPPEELINKHKEFVYKVDSQRLLIKGNESVGQYRFSEGTPLEGYRTIYLDSNQQVIKNRWLYDYDPKGQYSSSYTLSCRYFKSELKQIAIPEKYGRLIQYVDCMIDTNATIFLSDKYVGGGVFDLLDQETTKVYPNMKALSDFIDNKRSQKSNSKSKDALSDKQFDYAIKNLSQDTAFHKVLYATIQNCLQKNEHHYQLEMLAEKSGLYQAALQMKRSYKIMGSCSQDSRPREHARDIAVLAAQAHSWDIFLRSHLDIMNDRFERASDGSYAYGRRKTYLKELEELNLNIIDLMLGLTLRADNTAENHYFGTVWRLGWALTESKEKERFESEVIPMIKDSELDEFNRGLLFMLYTTYLGYLDAKEGQEKREQLRKMTDQFPPSIQYAIKHLKEPEKEE